MAGSRSHIKAWGVLLAYFLSMVLGDLHLIFEDHVRCPHGQWIHVEHHGGEIGKSIVPEQKRYQSDERSEQSHHRHVHCHVTVLSGDVVHSIQKQLALPIFQKLFKQPIARILTNQIYGQSAGIYTYAPKHSPPRSEYLYS